MPRTCTIHNHPRRREIEQALLARRPYRHIASQFGVSTTPLQHHAKVCIPDLLARVQEFDEAAHADDLRVLLQSEMEDIQRLKKKAEDAKDYRTALDACGRALKTLELQARADNIIKDEQRINITLSREWIEIKAVLLGVLGEHHPAALDDVVLTLQSRGMGRAIETPAGDLGVNGDV